MKRQINLFLFLLIGFIAKDAFSQEVIIKKRNVENETYYGGSRTGSYKSSNDKTSRSRARASSKYSHCLKYNLLPFFIGEFPVSYEYKINPFITLEGGLGITSNNHMDQLLYINDDFYAEPTNVLRNGLNLSHNAMIKVFPDAGAMDDGFYIAIDYKNRPYSKILDNPSFSQKATKLFIDIGLILGLQIRSSENLLMDFYAGLSQRHITWDRLSLIQSIDPNTGDLVTIVDITQNQYPTLGVLLGFKLGYLF